ncbi:MAG TPA: class I SAM-dependent methyltransferase [Fibrobacteria bacterium]|nr:class I SAM-dependent methyltransferase [Fibrobacteria bacterium]HOX52916.1 class I SAM-dependent methyltransferase [Fibrobacteria bacterium]
MRLQPTFSQLESIESFRRRIGLLSIPCHPPLVEAFRELDPLLGPRVASPAASPSGVDEGRRLTSCLCNQVQLQSEDFRNWLLAMRQNPDHLHRKHWEWAFIAQALAERGKLRAGVEGMGFAVGQEPLTSLFCARGCRILATDAQADLASGAGWVATGQHADSLAALNKLGLVDEATLKELASFRVVDMRDIPPDLSPVDFLWSACAFEHLGNLEEGIRFVLRSFDLLKPGGVAVHTTEYNMDSEWTTIGCGSDSIFRRGDLERIAQEIRGKGGKVRLDFTEGTLPGDLHVDRPPFRGDVHLRLELFGYRCTSFGLILEKPS